MIRWPLFIDFLPKTDAGAKRRLFCEACEGVESRLYLMLAWHKSSLFEFSVFSPANRVCRNLGRWVTVDVKVRSRALA